MVAYKCKPRFSLLSPLGGVKMRGRQQCCFAQDYLSYCGVANVGIRTTKQVVTYYWSERPSSLWYKFSFSKIRANH